MTAEQERKIRQVLADLATNVEAAYIGRTQVLGSRTRLSPREAAQERESAMALAFGQIAMILAPSVPPGSGIWEGHGLSGDPGAPAAGGMPRDEGT